MSDHSALALRRGSAGASLDAGALSAGSRWQPATGQFLAFGAALAIVHVLGIAGDLPMLVLSVVTPFIIWLGVRTHRPSPAWPWLVFIVAGIVWSVAGALRAEIGTTGDLSAGRSLLPDAFAVTGYTLFAVALWGMLRAQGQRARSRSVILDAAIMAVSAGIVAWVALISPVLYHADAAPIAKLAIVLYPPISAGLVSLASRLAFAERAGGTSHRLLLAGTVALLVGDVAYVPLELSVLGPETSRLLEFPYALAYALIGAAALHSSMRSVVRSETVVGTPRSGRFLLIAVAMLTPIAPIVFWYPHSLQERLVIGALVAVLAVAAVTRIVLASRSQALVEAHLELRATTDELTGLPNRAAARTAIARALDDARATGGAVSVLFVDLDRFKLINDSYGHVVGDELLLAAAQRLRSSVGETMTIARLSGDEFLVVAAGYDTDRATVLAARVCQAFTEPFELMGHVYITASIGVGVAEAHHAPTDATGLIRDADTAMYEAKAAGRSAFVVFDPEMRERTERQLELHSGLRSAIEHGEFEVHFQIVVHPGTRDVHGVEALVRWRRDGELVPPLQFIPLAEETGLISPIGEFVLRESCMQVARWRHLPGCEDLTVAVNLSARQLVDCDMVAVVAAVLDETRLPADALWLEITESVMMSDTIEMLATLSGLRELGVHLSVDDFGTGYSSLSYLHRYPVDQVKVDRRFINGLCEETRDAAVVSAIMGIAEALGLSLVAEGVETPEQADRLCELGFELAQGYLFGRPAPALDIGPTLVKHHELQGPR